MKRAFTITELLVAIGLLAAVLAASGLIFHYSVDAQRTASATSEIMRNLRAITDQLNADFDGLYKDAPLIVYSRVDGTKKVRADKIVFFSTGDFRTTRQYDDKTTAGNKTVAGNVARVFYGQSDFVSGVCPNPLLVSPEEDRRKKILVRKQVILTLDQDVPMSNPGPSNNDPCEYETTSLADQISKYVKNENQAKDDWGIRPAIDPNNEEDIPLFFARGVDNFTVQVDANDLNRIDPNGVLEWQPENDDIDSIDEKHYPNAIKFTFTLYDSKGIIKNGREFTHIVYVGD